MLWTPVAAAQDFIASGQDCLLLVVVPDGVRRTVGRWDKRHGCWHTDAFGHGTQPLLYQRMPDIPHEVSIQWHEARKPA